VLRETTGTGLRTLRERFAIEPSWRGDVETQTSPGAGFTVRVRLAAISGAAVPRSPTLQSIP
jgi:hypothetical protein